MERPITNYPPRFTFDYSVSAAKKYIDMFYQIRKPNAEQRCMLAAAHYTLALQDQIPFSQCKMHTNAAITLLQNVKNRTEELNSMIASAYFKRAELFEYEHYFSAAGQDYRRILGVFEDHKDISTLAHDDKLMLAQSAISLADLILNQQIDIQEVKQSCKDHPLFYVNKSLEYLTELPKGQDEIWTTLAYAHQIAGIALSSIDVVEAKEAFRTAIAMAFKADPKIACRMLGDIYNSLGLLYEQQFHECPIQKVPANVNDHAFIYLGLALLFQPNEDNAWEEQSLLDTLFDTIYRALDPFLPSLSNTVIRDFIDALIFTYYCVSDDILPNQQFCLQLKEPDMFNTFAHHIYWLVAEFFRRDHHTVRLLEIIKPCEYDLAIDLSVSLESLMNSDQNKIYYLKPGRSLRSAPTEAI